MGWPIPSAWQHAAHMALQSGRRPVSKDTHSGPVVRAVALMISELPLGPYFLLFESIMYVHSLPLFPPVFSPLVPVGCVSPGIIPSLWMSPFRWLIISTVHTHTDLLIKYSQSATPLVFSSNVLPHFLQYEQGEIFQIFKFQFFLLNILSFNTFLLFTLYYKQSGGTNTLLKNLLSSISSFIAHKFNHPQNIRTWT